MEIKTLQRTNLIWDNYMDFLIEEIFQSKFMKRAKDKPMFATSHEQEVHRTTRLEHSLMTASIAQLVAKSLNLNDKFAYAAMLLHDAGHPFSAHDGEEMFNGEGILDNIQYFHHNAEGVKVIKAEQIFLKAIDKIPNIDSMPDLRAQLIEEIPYFMDVVISHDGEATPQDMYKKPIDYPDIKTAVDEKMKMATANSGNYKFTAQTPEGQIAKFADVIAYLATDIQDRFRSGLHTSFPEEYLILLGDILATDYIAGGKEDKILIAKTEISKIEKKYLKEKVYKTEKNKEIIIEAERIAKEILKEDIDINNIDEVNAKVEEALSMYNVLISKAGGEEKKKLESEKTKLKRCIGNFISARSGVIKKVTEKMQEYFINDLLKNSKDSDYLHFSKPVEELFFKAKTINYKYVPKAKWHYLDKGQPEAVNELVSFLATALKRTGVIENLFYDESIREQVEVDKDAIKYMKTLHKERDMSEEYKKAKGIADIRTSNKKYAGGNKDKETAFKELFAAAYTYTQDTEHIFAEQYLNTFYAIENQVTFKVDSILGRLTEADKKARTTHVNFYDELIAKDEEELKKYIEDEYKCSVEDITEEQRKEIIKDLVHFQRLTMEDKMAKQIAIAYLSGQTDTSFKKLAKDTGVWDTADIFAKRSDKGNTKLEALSREMGEIK